MPSKYSWPFLRTSAVTPWLSFFHHYQTLQPPLISFLVLFLFCWSPPAREQLEWPFHNLLLTIAPWLKAPQQFPTEGQKTAGLGPTPLSALFWLLTLFLPVNRLVCTSGPLHFPQGWWLLIACPFPQRSISWLRLAKCFSEGLEGKAQEGHSCSPERFVKGIQSQGMLHSYSCWL